MELTADDETTSNEYVVEIPLDLTAQSSTTRLLKYAYYAKNFIADTDEAIADYLEINLVFDDGSTSYSIPGSSELA